MIKTRHILILLTLSLLLTACSDDKVDALMKKIVVAPPAYIERDIKGHEQIYSWQVILRLARRMGPTELSGGSTVELYKAYDLSHRETPIPVYQDITFRKDENGNITISSERKAFEVVRSDRFCYAMEIRYFDANGILINHQFAQYDPNDPDNSTLCVHQHFFTIRQNSLDGGQLVYPMTLDSLYYDRFLFEGESLSHASLISAGGVYTPEDYTVGSGMLRYDRMLAEMAVENTMTSRATQPLTHNGHRYVLAETIQTPELNQRVPELFSYEYRDTDPVEEQLGEPLEESDDLGRNRAGGVVVPLRQKREYASPGVDLDRLGFKGLIRFGMGNVCFQMRVSICHIQDRVQVPAGLVLGKYANTAAPGGLYDHYELQSSWNTFDIDYPVPFIVLGDVANREQCRASILRYYADRGREVDESALEEMLWGDDSYFTGIPGTTF